MPVPKYVMRLKFLVLLQFAPACFAQQATAPDHDMFQMEHSHEGFMQGGTHPIAKSVPRPLKHSPLVAPPLLVLC